MKYVKKRLLLLLGFSPFLTGFGSPQLECGSLPDILELMLRGHYAQEAITENIKERAIEQYIQTLDPTKTVFLKDEVTGFKSNLLRSFEKIEDGNCQDLNQIASLSVERTEQNQRYASELLVDGYQLDKAIELQTDSTKRGYPDSLESRKKLIQSMIHFQVSNQLLSEDEFSFTVVDEPQKLANREILSKISKRLIHRYELATKRATERREVVDVPELFAQSYAMALDPHSAYYSADQLADFRIQMGLSLEGIGAVLRSEDGYTRIVSIVVGGPADKEGSLRANDKIIAVKNESTETVSTIDMDLSDVVKMIRGKKGTKVTLTIMREGTDTKTFDITITRDKVDVKDQAAKISYKTKRRYGKEYTLGIIDLPSFYGDSNGKGRDALEDVRALINEAKSKNVDGILLDLSENGGGLLSDAVSISGLFLKQGVIVGTSENQPGLDEDRFEELHDKDPSIEYNGPLVVLVSQASASASEILAGALQDYQRALIVGGKNTFGKGTVQQFYPLPGDIGAIKITKGMFFRPSGASTQHVGVQSNIHIPSLYDGADFGEADLDYSLPPQTMLEFTSESTNSTNKSEQWKTVTSDMVAKLSQKSSNRVKSSKVFQEIQETIVESQTDDGIVKIADLLEQRMKDTTSEKEDDDLEKKQEAFLNEGVNILVDLIKTQQ